jgi:hypothetical protein
MDAINMEVKKRVLQISLDIVVGCKCDGFDLADDVANELNRRGFKVVGAGFQEDMTECYIENYSELMEV